MYLTAIDIGSNQVKALVAEMGKRDKLHLIEVFVFPSAGVRKGEISDAQELTHVLSNLFFEIRKINKSALKNIFINLGGKNIKIQNSRGIVAVSHADNEIYPDDIERVIKASQAVNLSSNRKILHTVIQEFIVDGVDQIRNPVGMSGARLEVNSLIVDAFGPNIADLHKSVEIAGGKISDIVFSPLASAHAVLNKTQKELGSVLIDIGFGTTGMAIFEEDKLVAAKVFPIGSSNITNDLAIALKSSIETADRIKTSYGHAFSRDVSAKDKIDLNEIDESLNAIISRKYISEIVEVRLAEIFELVHNELKSLGKTQLPAGAVLCGGGAKIDGIINLAKHELKLPVRFASCDLNVFDSANQDVVSKIEDPEFALPLGLVIYGYNQNLKPESSGKIRLMAKILRNFLP